MNIYLIGMMGSGKSTVGKTLSKKMHKPFIDLDSEIEKGTGKNISEIFDIDGEEQFRKMETKQLKQYSESIVACGGGIVLKDENREFINENGATILLTASMEELSHRLSDSGNRPLLADDNTEEALTKLWLERQLHYLNTADFTIETDGKNPEQLTKEILVQINP
ncbi:MAG: shikimate kinase [Candidatus Marinimicrobia bacterium]|nr:shikimate kinase [Candidatus Neomarinimicrobiota bacterium]